MREISRKWCLSDPEQRHTVEICQDEYSEIRSVCNYLREGLRHKESIIIFAPSVLRKKVLTNLRAEDSNFETYKSEGRIVCFDLEFILCNVLINNIFIEKSFHDFVSNPIKNLQLKFKQVRVYVGMTPLLWKEGQYDLAAHIENCWIYLAKKHNFKFCTSYLLNSHPSLAPSSLYFLYDCYSHLIPKIKFDPFRVESHKLMNFFEETWQKFIKETRN